MERAKKIMELLNEGRKRLQKCGIRPAQLEAGVLLAHVVGCDRSQLYLNKESDIDVEKSRMFLQFVDKRCRGVPLQYITRHQEFMGLDFYVDERVFIPRGDTEILVEYVIKEVKSSGIKKILEIGTGSGAIAISLAKFLPGVRVAAVDISEGALEVARKNAFAHGVADRIEFLGGDLFSPFAGNGRHCLFDVMVSNPPYIPSYEIAELDKEVKDFEPRLALDGGSDGLYFYRKLAQEAVQFLKRGGLWVVEVGYNQAGKVRLILERTGYYSNIRTVKDLAGIDRVVSARIC